MDTVSDMDADADMDTDMEMDMDIQRFKYRILIYENVLFVCDIISDFARFGPILNDSVYKVFLSSMFFHVRVRVRVRFHVTRSVAERKPQGAKTFGRSWSRNEVSDPAVAPGQTKLVY